MQVTGHYSQTTSADLPVLQSLSLYAIYGLPAPLRVVGVAVSARDAADLPVLQFHVSLYRLRTLGLYGLRASLSLLVMLRICQYCNADAVIHLIHGTLRVTGASTGGWRRGLCSYAADLPVLQFSCLSLPTTSLYRLASLLH